MPSASAPRQPPPGQAPRRALLSATCPGVSAHRQQEPPQAGTHPNKRTQGTGNPNRPLEERTRDERYNMARDKNIPQRCHMSKGQLLKALQHR
jgi:hypothetical protein